MSIGAGARAGGADPRGHNGPARTPIPRRALLTSAGVHLSGKLSRLARGAARALAPGANLRSAWRLAGWLGALARQSLRRRRDPRLAVAVDASPLWERLTGVGWYLYRLLEHLAPRTDLVLRLYGPDLIAGPGVAGPAVAPPAGPAIERVTHAPPELAGGDLVARVSRRLLAAGGRYLAPLLIAADGNRVVFAPNYFPPRRFGLALALCRRRAGGLPLVATVHDLSYRVVPETMRPETLAELRRHMDRVWREAALVLTDSHAVRAEIVAAGFASPHRVRAIQLAAAHPPRPPGGSGARPPGTPGAYGLFVGTLEPRKNLGLLLAAWRSLRRRLPAAPALVLCGRFGWKSARLREAVASAGAEGWLVHVDGASDGELAALYAGARLVALPSLYEGFGLPALEALAAGVPLVASDIPVLREVAGEAALYAPPDRPEVWAERLAEVLGDGELARALAAGGPARAAAFDWARTAEETAAAFREMART